MTRTIQVRRGTTAEWNANSSARIADGEPFYDTTTEIFRVSDETTWNSVYNLNNYAFNYIPYSYEAGFARGIVAIGSVYDPAPTVATDTYLTPLLRYNFDPTRRYRIFYTIRALAGHPNGGTGGTLQFWLVNAANTQLAQDQIISADPTFYSGQAFSWLFTYNGTVDMRIKVSGFNSAGTTTVYGRDFYIEDVGKYP